MNHCKGNINLPFNLKVIPWETHHQQSDVYPCLSQKTRGQWPCNSQLYCPVTVIEGDFPEINTQPTRNKNLYYTGRPFPSPHTPCLANRMMKWDVIKFNLIRGLKVVVVTSGSQSRPEEPQEDIKKGESIPSNK